MRERDIEVKLRKSVAAQGGFCWKFTSPGTAGVPDRIILMPKGTIAFVEVNDEGKISCIRTSDNARYHFRVDEAWRPTEEEDDENEEPYEVRPMPAHGAD